MVQTTLEGRSDSAGGFWSAFRPDHFADSVFDIDLDWLRQRGLRGLLVDVDNTLMPRNETIPGVRVRAWISALRRADVPLLVISNNWSSRVKTIASELDLEVIAPAGKPFRPAFIKGLDLLGLPADETAIVGDQVFTDILGGNRAGLASVLVPPLGTVDLVHTKVLRVLERALLRRLAGQVLRDGRWSAI